MEGSRIYNLKDRPNNHCMSSSVYTSYFSKRERERERERERRGVVAYMSQYTQHHHNNCSRTCTYHTHLYLDPVPSCDVGESPASLLTQRLVWTVQLHLQSWQHRAIDDNLREREREREREASQLLIIST